MNESTVKDENDVTMVAGSLGTHVNYRSAAYGYIKTALVIGTPESVPADGADRVPALVGNERHLMVFSPTGSTYVKHNVVWDRDNGGCWF